MRWWSLLLLPTSFGVLTDIRGSSLFGLETQLGNTDCSWERPASYYIDELGRRGFNWLRVPFSAEYIRNDNFSVMDDIFDSASKWNMSVLLDWHRNINAFQDNWLENITIDDYFSLYKKLIFRYYYNPTLKMIGLFNEYKGTDPIYWSKEMDMVVRELEKTFPERFYWLIGCPQWSGLCRDMDWSYLPFQDRVYVDHHKYIFSNPSTPQGWDTSFYHDHSKVVVGEWGFFSDHPEQVQWAHTFVNWLKEKNIRNSFFWVSVSNSGDTGGLWKECKVFEETKYQVLKDLWGQKRRLTNDTDEDVVMDYTDYTWDYDIDRYDGSTGYLRGSCP